MDKFKFDSEFINNYFKEKTGKFYFDTIEDLKIDEGIKIEFSEKNQSITQHDLDLLVEISTKFELLLKFKNINFNGISFEKDKGYALFFEECDLRECEFKGCERESLSFSSCIVGENFSDKLKQMKKLKSITLEKQEDIDLGELKGIDSVNIGDIKDINILRDLKNIKVLEITGEDKNVKNIELLRQFKQLKELCINNIYNIEGNLPESPDLESLTLNHCGFSNIESIEKYEHLQVVNLDDNNLTEKSLEKLKKLSRKVQRLSFEKNPLADLLQKQLIKIRDKSIEEIFKRNSESKLSKYDFIAKKMVYEINDIKTLEKIFKSATSKFIINTNIRISIDNFEDISIDILNMIANAGNLEIEIKSFRGLTPDILKILDLNQKIKFYVEGDLCACDVYKDKYYTPKDMQEILNVMELIKNSVMENSSELKKFLAVYKSISMIADYDYSGCMSSKNFAKEMLHLTRSLKGVLIEGKAVCVGYSLALKYCLDYIGIEARDVGGKTHAWIQVKIDEKWYNCDLTWDYLDVRRGLIPEYCLRSDIPFNLYHKRDRDKIVEQCKENYPKEKIGEILKELHTDFDMHQENLEKDDMGAVTMQDYQNIANSTIISTTIISRIKSILKNTLTYNKKKDEQKIKNEDEK